jgi:hypothetical protein
MEAGDRLALVAAAAASVGPVEDPAGWAEQVRARALDLYVMSRDRGAVGRALDQLEACRTYVATVLGGRIEKHALQDGGELRRGLVRLKVDTSKFSKDGVEEIRTELLSTPEGTAVWEKVRGLAGHRVLVYAQTEQKDERKVKTLRHVEDLRQDHDVDVGEAAGTDAPGAARSGSRAPDLRTAHW